MAKLILPDKRTIDLLPGDAGRSLMALLLRAGFVFDAPCGGEGRCGKCAALIVSGDLTPPDADELRTAVRSGAGYRLLCRARIADTKEDIVLGTLPASLTGPSGTGAEAAPADQPARNGAEPSLSERKPDPGLVLAIDLGTTTLELALLDKTLPQKSVLARTRVPNPQRVCGADVMSRLSAARRGKAEELRLSVVNELLRQTGLLLDRAGRDGFPETVTLCGNPAMLCLALGIETKGLLRAPFTLPESFGKSYPLDMLFSGSMGSLYVPPVTGPFTGADLTCALVASGFDALTAPALFCDLGTNAEVCLFGGEGFTCCSAAAGPAFEGAGIRMGGGWGPGAITRVTLRGGKLFPETFDRAPADHLSANGLFDAAAALLSLGKITPAGTIVSEAERENGIRIGDTKVFLYKEDIRALQVAKAAVRAALGLLIERSGIPGPVPLYVTGGIAVSDAFRTLGIIPPECEPINAAGALEGATLLARDPNPVMARMRRLAARCTVLPLAGDPAFEEAFLAALPFPE